MFDPILGSGIVEQTIILSAAERAVTVEFPVSRRPRLRLVSLFFSTCILLWLFVMGFILKGYDRSIVTRVANESWKPKLTANPRGESSRRERFSEQEKLLIASQTHFIAQLISHAGELVVSDARRLARWIVFESVRAGYDPLLVTAIIKAESTFNDRAVSARGAYGLMQIMPATGKYIASWNGESWNGSLSLKDPQHNIRLGIAYLKHLEQSFNGDRELALIAYNWGPANLSSALKNGNKIPSSPARYAKKILQNHAEWRSDLDSRLAYYKHLDVESVLS